MLASQSSYQGEHYERPAEFWLDEDGNYWASAQEYPDPGAAARVLAEGTGSDDLRLLGRGNEYLRDCTIDHICPSSEVAAFHEGTWCEAHPACPNPPCPEWQMRDVWHFADPDTSES